MSQEWRDPLPFDPIGAGMVIDGRYRLERNIGHGGMGSVWSALHLRLGTRIAIKIASPAVAGHPEARYRFEVEARAAAALRCENVVEVFDVGVLPSGLPYLAMELLEGESLQDRLQRTGPLHLTEVGNVLAQVGRALLHAHARGVVHRDIKPDNVFLTKSLDDERTIAKVLDFGIAKVSTAARHTAAGAVLGSIEYMSPEQAEGRPVDLRTDVYSLGATACALLTGHPPYVGASYPDVLRQLVFAPLPKLTDRVARLPAGLDGWFRCACARDPDHRYQTVREAMGAFFVAAQITPESPALAELYQLAPERSGIRERFLPSAPFAPSDAESSWDDDDPQGRLEAKLGRRIPIGRRSG